MARISRALKPPLRTPCRSRTSSSAAPCPRVSIWWPWPSARMRWKFSWPARFSAIHSRANVPSWISPRTSLMAWRVVVGDDPLAAREVAVLGRVGDRVAHAGDPLLVHQVDDQLELVQALEVRQLGVVAGVDQRLVAGAHELGHAAAEHGLLAEEVGLGLVLERRLDHAAAGAADALGVGQRELLRVAGRVRVDRDQARDARALEVLAADQVARALGGDERDVDLRPGPRPRL